MTDINGYGAVPVGERGFALRVWAPDAPSLEAVLEGPDQTVAMTRRPDGSWVFAHPMLTAGRRYRFKVGDGQPFPDPNSRYQPEGVHGPSQIIDPRTYRWGDADWKGQPLSATVVYEMHVGTFTPGGTFDAARGKLPYLKELGVTAVELMPVGDFPGARNWGYDLVSVYAPARCYGTPDGLRRFVDEAHQIGLAVLLDVVYNHLGPDGNYQGVYSPYYVSKAHSNPWGASFNFDGENSKPVRETFIQNAEFWVRDYHFDGLRLDATHAIIDDSADHFLAELTRRVRAAAPDREVVVIAEDHRNLAHLLQDPPQGYGLDGVWADDFHHENRRLTAGDDEGYYQDFRGSAEGLATVLNQGWLFTGQYSKFLKEDRGTDPAGLRPEQPVICIQNHDQVGNRALGERLTKHVDLPTYLASSALLLLAPQTPMLFMGQEWAASSPFLYFTDHNEELGRLVTEGRRREFKEFRLFADPASREKIPDPQAESTFTSSRLDWGESTRTPHAGVLNLYKALLELRRTEPCLRESRRSAARAAGGDVVVLVRLGDNSAVAAVCRLRGSGPIDLRKALTDAAGPDWSWRLLLSTEAEQFLKSPQPITVDEAESGVTFTRPGAVLLAGRPAGEQLP